MKKNKIFIACDTTNIKKIKEIIKKTEKSKINFGYRINIYTNSNIKMNGFFLNLIFGYSYLARKS